MYNHLNTSFKTINEDLNLSGGEKKKDTTTSHTVSDAEKFSKQGTGTTGDNVTRDTMADVIKTKSGLTNEEVTNITTNYQAVHSAICAEKLTICQKIYKEYMQIVKAHVMSYVGEQVKDEKVADKGQDYTQQPGAIG